jgi:hypothetical protein
LHVFPDTSNTCYGLHCEATIELLVKFHHYIRFLGQLLAAKTKSGFISIEENIYSTLNNWSTLSELMILALYLQITSQPYIAYVQSYTESVLNLGTFHECVMNYIHKLIEQPELALASDASTEAAILLGMGWERSDVQSATITDTQRNSKAMRKLNGTEDWVPDNFTNASYAFCRKEARRVDESGEARRGRAAQYRVFVNKAAANKLKRVRLEAKRELTNQKLAATVLERNPEALQKCKLDKLGDMLDKWRETDKLVPFRSKLRKGERLQAVLDAIKREKEKSDAGGCGDVGRASGHRNG